MLSLERHNECTFILLSEHDRPNLEVNSWTKPYLARDVRGKYCHLSPTEAAARIADRKGATGSGFVWKSA